MKAARFYAAGDVRVEEIPVPTITDDSALIGVEWCGICGSDLHEYVVGPQMVPPPERPHHVTGEHLPVTMGHEFCGRVQQLPDNYPETGTMKVGQKVMVDPRIVCRDCTSCKEYGTVFCKHLGFVGLSGRGGGLSETVAVKLDMCYPLNDHVDMRLVALIEPLAVARHAARISGISDYQRLNVLVLGGGPIGQAVVIDLKSMGVGQIIVSEPTELRRKQIEKLGTHVIDAKTEDVPSRCMELTEENGIDVVFDCAGVAPAMHAALAALKVRAMYMNVAGWESPFTLPLWLFMAKELVIRGSLAYEDEDFAEVVKRFSEGQYTNLESMVTARISLDDVVKGGFEQLIHHKDKHVKILVSPKPELLTEA